MKTLITILLCFIISTLLFSQEEVKLKFSGIDKMVIKRNTNGDLQLVYPNNASENIFIGEDAGNNNSGAKNIGLGQLSLSGNIIGSANTAIGYRAGAVNSIGNKNVFLGANAGLSNVGSENVLLGHGSGENNEGSGNIFIGSGAGANVNGSNKLIVDNGFNSLPFIYGEMDNQILNINGKLNVSDTVSINNLSLIKEYSPSLTLQTTNSNSPKTIRAFLSSYALQFQTKNDSGNFEELMALFLNGQVHSYGGLSGVGRITAVENSGTSTFRLAHYYGTYNYDLMHNIDGFLIRYGPSNDRMFLSNDLETFLYDKVIIENELNISNTLESKILLETTTSGGHDWEVLAKNGDLFFRGGADGSGNDLFNKVTIRNDGDLEVCGKISATSAVINTISCSSDFRFKKNIVPLKSVLSKVILLQGVSYEWNLEDFPEKGFSEDPQIGFVAQDVEELFPEVVKTDEEGYKSIDYARLTPLLVESIKEQQGNIEELTVLVKELSRKVIALEAQ